MLAKKYSIYSKLLCEFVPVSVFHSNADVRTYDRGYLHTSDKFDKFTQKEAVILCAFAYVVLFIT